MTEKPWDYADRRARCRTCDGPAHPRQATHNDEPVNRLALLGVVISALIFWCIAGALLFAWLAQ